MALLFGSESVAPLSLLHKEFVRVKLEKFENVFEASPSSYLPIVSNSKNFEYISSLNEVSDFKTKLSNKFKIPITTQTLYSKLPSLPPISGLNPKFYVVDINNKEIERFSEHLDQAFEIISNHLPWAAEIFNILIQEVCPIARIGKVGIECEFGFSDFRLIGTIFTSLRGSANPVYDMTQSLVHELGHNIVYLLQTGQDLFVDLNITHVYSGIRKVERPIYGAFHGAVALAYMKILALTVLKAGGLSNEDERNLTEKFNQHSQGLKLGLDSIRILKLTDLGKSLFEELEGVSDIN